MKKTLFLFFVLTALFSSCNNGPKKSELISQNDSLKNVIAERDAALDEMINTINVVEEGFKAINEAQGRVKLDASSAEQSKVVSLQKDVNFINETLESNKRKIAELEEKLKKNQSYSGQLKQMVEKLKVQLEEKNRQVAALQSELSGKNIHIEELDKTVKELTGNVERLTVANTENEKTINTQDEELNSVWYAIGTKSELKGQNILDGKKVLGEADANMSYFTKADMRKLSVIETHSKSAKLLTVHPKESYKLERNSDKQYVLTILNAKNFWSVSKYLVIQVK